MLSEGLFSGAMILDRFNRKVNKGDVSCQSSLTEEGLKGTQAMVNILAQRDNNLVFDGETYRAGEVCVCVCVYIYMRGRVDAGNTLYMHACIHTHMNLRSGWKPLDLNNMHTCVVCMSICIGIHGYMNCVYVYMHRHTWIHEFVCMSICIDIHGYMSCVYVHMHRHTWIHELCVCLYA